MRDGEGWLMNIVENDFMDLPFIEGSICENRTMDNLIQGENVPYNGSGKWKPEDIIYLTGDAEENMEEFDPR
jgi:hypothetical protein